MLPSATSCRPRPTRSRSSARSRAQRCAVRLRELMALGLDRIVVVPGSRDSDPALLDATNAALAREVLPGLRG